MDLVHTEVPPELKNHGVGHKIVREALSYLDHQNQKIVPLCPFIRTFIKKNLEDFKHLLTEDVKL